MEKLIYLLDGILANYGTIILLGVYFYTYVFFIGKKYKNIPSISDSAYQLGFAYAKIHWFTLWIIGLTLIMINIALSLNNELLFISSFFMGIVGLSTNFHFKHDGIPHFISATLGIVLSMVSINTFELGITITANMRYSLYGIMIGLVLIKLRKKRDLVNLIYWIEVISFTIILIRLFEVVKVSEL